MAVVVHAANIQDKPGAVLLMERCAGAFARLAVIFGDGAYKGPTVQAACQTHHGCGLQVISRPQADHFVIVPKRWIVERTFAWLGRNRRLSKGYEELPQTSVC